MSVDAAQRQFALDPSASFIVQAPAGSGKTGLLIQRFLVLLAIVNEPEEILAITFTRKAAAEMGERILAALSFARTDPRPVEPYQQRLWDLAAAALKRSQNRNWQLETYPARLKIYTIDAFCRSLTRRMPFSSGLGLSATPSDKPEKLYIEAVDQLFQVLEQPSNTDTDFFTRHCQNALQYLLPFLDNDLPRLKTLLISMLGKRDQWLRHVFQLFQFIHADLAAFSVEEQNDIQHHLDKVRQQFERSLQETVGSHLKQLHQAALMFLTQAELDQVMSICQIAAQAHPDKLHLVPFLQASRFSLTADRACLPYWKALAKLFLTTEGKARTRYTAREGFPAKENYTQQLLALIQPLVQDLVFLDGLRDVTVLPDLEYEEAEWEKLKHLIFLLVYTVAKLKEVFIATGEVDFNEITQAALAVFGEEHGGIDCPTDLALRLDYQIKHILFDEFQDTSFVQYALLQKLTQGWQQEDGRTVFIVGDPMQSIYSFREANVSLFLRAKQPGAIQPGLALHNLVLQQNFRSTLGLVTWFNKHLCHILPQVEQIATGAIPYTPAFSDHALVYDTHFYEAVTYHAIESEETAVYGLQEAERIIEIIRHTQAYYQQHDPTHTIAVLVRTRDQASALMTQLQQQKIAYLPVKIERLLHAPIVQDLLALTRALMHPADRIAWLALLRAPFVGLNLKELSALFANQQSYALTVFERLDFFMTEQDDLSQILRPCRWAKLHLFLETMRLGLKKRQLLAFSDLVQGVWLKLNAAAYFTEVEQKIANDYFQLLKKVMSTSHGYYPTLETLLEELAGHYIDAKIYDENPVQIMTIHQAKGLEFGTVILPALHGKTQRSDGELLEWLERDPLLSETGLLLAPMATDLQNTEQNSQIYAHIRHVKKQRLQYERQRLLYVALTRAEKHLHLIAKHGRAAKESLLADLFQSKAIEETFLSSCVSPEK